MTTDGLRQQFTHCGFFVFRTPLLPIDDFLDWGTGLAFATLSDQDTPERWREVILRDRETARMRVLETFNRPEVLEGLFVASPDSTESLQRSCVNPGDLRRLEHTLVRYFERMTVRPTPFGLFAGTSVGRVHGNTSLALGDKASYSRCTRLDSDYVFNLAHAVARLPHVRFNLKYRPNHTLYRVGDRLRYVESSYDGGAVRHDLVAVEQSEALALALEAARTGATHGALVDCLSVIGESRAETQAFIDDLVSCGLLEDDLVPSLTGTEPAQQLGLRLRGISGCEEIAEKLREIEGVLADIDRSGVGAPLSSYSRVTAMLEQLPFKPTSRRLFQVDLFKPAPHATLGESVVFELLDALGFLARLQGGRPTDGRLANFRRDFAVRYGEREVPLLEALDEDVGLGFGPLQHVSTERALVPKGLFPDDDSRADRNWMPQHAWLLRKVADAVVRGAREIRLSSADLQELPEVKVPPMPDSFSIMATVMIPPERSPNTDDFQVFLRGVDGPSGAVLFGRFCHMDASLRSQVEHHLQLEEGFNPSAVYAEIIHLPQDRVANIACRPILRQYEIPYVGRSGVPSDHQIPLTDLTLSMVGGRLRLRSLTLNREVIPRLTCAQNYRALGNLPIYQFLCALQQEDGIPPPRWLWGPLENLRFLPRVVFGRVVLSRATWRVRRSELPGRVDDPTIIRDVHSWRLENGIPRFALLVGLGDELLPVDFENALSVETFVESTKHHSELVLTEMWPPPDCLGTSGPEGLFWHEIVVPIIRSPASVASPPRRLRPLVIRTQTRAYPPGSEWLYVKLYAGVALLDRVLLDLVVRTVRPCRARGVVDSWHFLRYGDPEWHLRLRVHGTCAGLENHVLPSLREIFDELLSDRTVSRIEFGTYEPETERYGGPEGVRIAQQIFWADSEAVTRILEDFGAGATPENRFRIALCGIDSLLTDLGLDLGAKLSVMRGARQTFAHQFRVDGSVRQQLAARYRLERQWIEQLLTGHEGVNSIPSAVAAFRTRSGEVGSAVHSLQGLLENDGLGRTIRDLALSYVHMHANRILRTMHQPQEFVLYDFLERAYNSRLVRLARAAEKHLSQA